MQGSSSCVLVTGAAGFIGYHVSQALLDGGNQVIGVDNLNDFYDPALKSARLARLTDHEGFVFEKLDIADHQAILALVEARPEITGIIHLAAQAGVRYSLVNPYAYVDSNVMGHVVMLEACRRLPALQHFVYASSSSVYGGNTDLPSAIEDRVDDPVSLYAATKRAQELLAHSYAHLYHLAMTGLRFFTVYGPWGRPDMAAYIFTKAIFEGKPIRIFNRGDMKRDFTYIDDIVAGVLAALARPPADDGTGIAHQIYNLGNHRSEELLHFIEIIEKACGREAIKEFGEMQPGDVKESFADIEASQRDLAFEPRTTIEEGIPRFVAWYRDYHGV